MIFFTRYEDTLYRKWVYKYQRFKLRNKRYMWVFGVEDRGRYLLGSKSDVLK